MNGNVSQLHNSPPEKPITGGNGNGTSIMVRIAVLETKLEHIEKTMATKTDIESLKTLIERQEASSLKREVSMHRWMIGTVIASLTLAVAAAFALFRIFA